MSDSQTEGATGHRGQDGHRVAVVELRVKRAQEADILIVHIDVNESMEATFGCDEPPTQARVLAIEVGQQVG